MDHTISFKLLSLLALIYCVSGRQLLLTNSGQAYCGKNEVIKESSPCRESCRSKVSKTAVTCTDEMVFGCYCDVAKEYVRHPTTKACVKASCCPSTQDFDYDCMPLDPYCGGLYEEFGYYTSCANKCGSSICTCKYSIYPGCYCKKGFYRRYDGLCVLKQDCDVPDNTKPYTR